MWGVLLEQVYRTKISDVDELKRRIKNEWADLNEAVIERPVGEWRKRLRACGASTRLRSRWRRTFRAYDVKMM